MNFREQGHAPVAYIEMDPKASPKSIASSILNFYGIPHNFTSATQHRHRLRVPDSPGTLHSS